MILNYRLIKFTFPSLKKTEYPQIQGYDTDGGDIPECIMPILPNPLISLS